MKRIFINDYFLNEDDLDYEVIRVKALIINSNNEVLLAHNNNTYQFLGGHREDKEALEDTLVREIKEETGMNLEVDNGPFMQITTYDNDYFGTSKKVCNKIYYFVVYSDDKPNFDETNYDELERQSEFYLVYVKVSELGNFLKRAVVDKELDEGIAREMLLVVNEYNKLYGGI